MRENDEFIGRVEDYLVDFDGATPLPGRVIDAIHAELPRTRQVKANLGFMRMPLMRSTISSRSPRGFAALAKLGVTAAAVLAIGVVGLTVLRPPSVGPAAELGTFEPVAGPIVCGYQDLGTGTVLGCSRDGTRLIQKGLAGNLFVLHADGSETQVSEALAGSSDVTGSARPTGATISPDGTRVVFAGKTVRGRSCHDGALFAIDADGGSAEVLWKSQRDGIVNYPTFSPDGTQIAFADGYCDSDHSVWVMNADGSAAHQIVSSEKLQGGHVAGLAWSPAGDRIALWFLEGAIIYTFATDGSGLTQDGDTSEFCWPGRRCPTTQPSLTATAAPTTTPTALSGWICESQFRDPFDTILGCSTDGTRILMQKGLDGNLFVLHADGSETQVTDRLSGSDVLGSARPSGATISPDGSRVVFAGKTKRGRSCHDGALFAVDADGGQPEVLWESHVAQNGIVRYPMFSPDGTRIAFADGYCDSSHGVWMMNADGSDAHQIVSTDTGPLGATHVHGLAWSAAGDRIAIQVDQGTYSFAPDGSDFTPVGDWTRFCWSGRRC